MTVQAQLDADEKPTPGFSSTSMMGWQHGVRGGPRAGRGQGGVRLYKPANERGNVAVW